MLDYWSNIEVELIVADYFNMLAAELKGERYNKAEHRRALLALLSNRNEAAIERKHMNISAALIKLGQPYIRGYLPLYNYQHVLVEKVTEFLGNNRNVESHFKLFAERKSIVPVKHDFETFIAEPPKPDKAEESQPAYLRNPIKTNYLEREQSNRNLGDAGEELVIYYEQWNLIKIGKEKLIDQIRWVSKDEGDGAGFDILSKTPDGKDKYIEVKTTKLRKETPFYFSRNELLFSQKHSEQYNLYRLFNFETNAKMFVKNGSFDSFCNVIPILFKGIIKK